jgi:hypothetical protein
VGRLCATSPSSYQSESTRLHNFCAVGAVNNYRPSMQPELGSEASYFSAVAAAPLPERTIGAITSLGNRPSPVGLTTIAGVILPTSPKNDVERTCCLGGLTPTGIRLSYLLGRCL